MQIKAQEISEIIKKKISDFEKTVEVAEVGTVITVGDGIAKVFGLDNVMSGELLELPGGLMGMALNLEEENVGVVLMGDDSKVREGDIVKRTKRIAEVPVGTPSSAAWWTASACPSTARVPSPPRSSGKSK